MVWREGVFQMTNCGVKLARGKGLACYALRIVPPASEREARMDDPTLRCENDAGNETRLLGAPDPKRGPHFFVRLTPLLSFG